MRGRSRCRPSRRNSRTQLAICARITRTLRSRQRGSALDRLATTADEVLARFEGCPRRRPSDLVGARTRPAMPDALADLRASRSVAPSCRPRRTGSVKGAHLDEIPTLRESGTARRGPVCRPSNSGRARRRRTRSAHGLTSLRRTHCTSRPARRRTNRQPSKNWHARPALRRHGIRFPVRHGRHLLAIGYNVGERRRDSSYYDLLASEARLCSFVAIAQGQLPQESWFALGRLLTTAGGEPMLLSWSGSMFEYLMPLLVMPTYENTLLDQTYQAAVERQIEYGRQRGVPWGISESGYNTVDVHLNYQYRAFGVPGLGLKRGLAEDLVIAPYASALALMVAPEEACLNLQRLAAEGLEGQVRLLRGHRLHAVASAARTIERGGALLHGASPGHEPALVSPTCCWTVRCRSASSPIRCSRRPCCCCRSAIPKATAFYSHTAELSDMRTTSERSGDAGARAHQPRHADSGGAAAVERPIPRDGHQRRRRLQPLEGPRRHALARRQHLRQLGHVLLHPRRGRAASSGRPPISRRSSRRTSYEGDLFRGAGGVPPPRSRFRHAYRDRRFAGRRHRTAPRPHHQPLARPAERSRSPATRKWCSHPPPRTRCIRRSAISSCRPRSFRERQAILCTRRPRSLDEQPPWMFHLMAVHGADIGDDLLRDGPHAVHRPRQHGRHAAAGAMSDAARAFGQRGLGARSDRRDPVSDHARSGAIGRRSTWCPASARRATAAWAWSRNTRIGVWRIASSSWPGPIARSCCGSSMPPRPTRNSTAAWPVP